MSVVGCLLFKSHIQFRETDYGGKKWLVRTERCIEIRKRGEILQL